MIIFHRAADMRPYLSKKRASGASVGFVPTMGALHPGHLRLIAEARRRCDTVVVSIFVNPTQFNDASDFAHYPTPLAQDLDLLLQNGCDVLYLPSVAEIYPQGTTDLPLYAIGYLDTILEGKYRPGHFQGVCQVVDRLLQAVHPDILFLGQKDLQQCRVIARLLQLTPHGHTTRLEIVPTVREADGLALSSRNLRLTPAARSKALALVQTLQLLKNQLRPGATEALLQQAHAQVAAAGLAVDYVSIADANTLLPCSNWDGQQQLVGLIAAYCDGVRLIDNMQLTGEETGIVGSQ
ncbi:MAG: pantoate--beta-alanine ligase [Lacibacter sp.]